MIERTARQRLQDMLDAIEAIEKYAAGKTFDDYGREGILRHAIERNVEIVSEASRHVPDQLKAPHSEISWRSIADIGNVFRHGYDRVNDRRVWRIVTAELQPLKVAVLAMIAEVEREAKG